MDINHCERVSHGYSRRSAEWFSLGFLTETHLKYWCGSIRVDTQQDENHKKLIREVWRGREIYWLIALFWCLSEVYEGKPKKLVDVEEI